MEQTREENKVEEKTGNKRNYSREEEQEVERRDGGRKGRGQRALKLPKYTTFPLSGRK